MSKTFGQLKVGDEVYIIKGSDIKIAKVKAVTHCAERNCTHFATFYGEVHTAMDCIGTWEKCGSIYCDIDDAMRRMQDICAKALRDYKCASGALNLLETKRNKYETRR